MKFIFVYNANSGAINGLLDSAHKIVSPSTYDCRLCDITFGVLTEKEEWKNFREASETEMIFLHKNEFLKQYRSKWLPKYTFPIILQEENNELHIFMNTPELNQLEDTAQLIAVIQEKVNG